MLGKNPAHDLDGANPPALVATASHERDVGGKQEGWLKVKAGDLNQRFLVDPLVSFN